MELTTQNILKVVKGAAIAGGGAAAVYALQAVGQFDLGQFSAMAAAIAAIVINAVRKYLEEYEQRNQG
jgi:hypothetical protein